MNVFKGYVHEDTGKFALDPIESKKFRAFVAKKFKGQEVDLEIRAHATKRSLRQNNAYHAAIHPWADFLGYDVEDLKDEMLGIVFGYKEVTSPVTGEVRQALVEPHTSNLSVQQFNELMERTVIVAAGTEYLMELPDEYKTRQKAEEKRTRVA
jgi:hypothetical protein